MQKLADISAFVSLGACNSVSDSCSVFNDLVEVCPHFWREGDSGYVKSTEHMPLSVKTLRGLDAGRTADEIPVDELQDSKGNTYYGIALAHLPGIYGAHGEYLYFPTTREAGRFVREWYKRYEWNLGSYDQRDEGGVRGNDLSKYGRTRDDWDSSYDDAISEVEQVYYRGQEESIARSAEYWGRFDPSIYTLDGDWRSDSSDWGSGDKPYTDVADYEKPYMTEEARNKRLERQKVRLEEDVRKQYVEDSLISPNLDDKPGLAEYRDGEISKINRKAKMKRMRHKDEEAAELEGYARQLYKNLHPSRGYRK